jgi:hypothetical protein
MIAVSESAGAALRGILEGMTVGSKAIRLLIDDYT